VDNYLIFLAARVKSAMYQGFTTELPPKVAGLDVSDIRRLAREHADLVCVSMQNALEDWKTEQNARRKAAAQEAKSA
jgi:poly-gamma-glutamate capsule biosynthesis protein CapA/YwtB (metallophosphatase superfamily)